MEEKGFIDITGPPTELGRKRIQPNRFMELEPERPELHIGPFGVSKTLSQDESLFPQLKWVNRKTIAVEMESAGLAEAADRLRIPFIISKGVSSHGDGSKDDLFQSYAAQAAASFLLHLLREIEV